MYRISLQQFEGPLDLLLFFIKRDEIDIYDIPIADIADEFLEYVRLLEKIDLDGVGDFIYMAALLINIKARMLLPNPETDEEGEPIDPRRELVERLLEYVRFKEAAERLDEQHEARLSQFTRGEASAPSDHLSETPDVEVDASVFDLVRSLEQLLVDEPDDQDEPTHDVEPFKYTVEMQRAFVIDELQSGRTVSFRRLAGGHGKPFLIATFLAVLELARQRHVLIQMGETTTDFDVMKPESATMNGQPSTL